MSRWVARKSTHCSFASRRRRFAERAGLLQKNVERIVHAATAHYRHTRARSEAVFRHELLSLVNSPPSTSAWYEDLLLTVLERMRDFWAFKATYLLHWEHNSGRLSAMAVSTQSSAGIAFDVGAKVLGTIRADLTQTHPLTWMFDVKRRDNPPNAWVSRFGSILTTACQDAELQVPSGRTYFLVSVPLAGEAYAFVFAVRDDKAVSPLRRLLNASASDLCQEAILGTATAVARELREVSHQIAREEYIKYEAWRRLSERVAHKIGNRVFAASGALQRLKHTDVEDDRGALDKIHRCLVQIDHTCDDFKRFSRLPPSRFEQTDVAALIQDELHEHESDFDNRHVDSYIAPHLPVCTWDKDQIRYAVAELLDNAIHHTPDNGGLRITVHLIQENESPRIQILIENAGPGIKASLKREVWEPFFTTRPDGSGLGLAIVLQIIRRHNGDIWEDGEPGRYARFVIELPVNPEME